MEKSRKRGKIPQTDWPLIMARYEAGETLSSIARTYDCSPPAISYIVSRNRDKPASEPPRSAVSEPQLLKTSANGSSAGEDVAAEPAVVVAAEAAPPHEPAREATVAAAPPLQRTVSPPVQPTGEPRAKLHLGFGNGNGNGDGHGNGNGAMAHAEPAPEPRQRPPSAQPGPQPFQAPLRPPAVAENGRYGHDFGNASRARPPAQAPRIDADARKDNGVTIDKELRSRVDGDIAVFLAAFDAVLAADTQESRFGLREATDRLLRAGARTRIELERLETRAPLTPRESGHSEQAGWRYR